MAKKSGNTGKSTPKKSPPKGKIPPKGKNGKGSGAGVATPPPSTLPRV